MASRHASSGRSRLFRTSDTPVAPDPPARAFAFARTFESVCLGRRPRPSVKMRRFVQPKVPSTVGGHPRTRVDRRRYLVRSRDVSAWVQRSAPLHSPLLVPRFRAARGYCELDPRPRPSSRAAILTQRADTRFSGSDCRPTTSATALPTHGHAPELPILVQIRDPAFRRYRGRALAPAPPFTERRPSPLEEGSRVPRAVTVLSKPAPRRCKGAVTHNLESHRPIGTSLAGDASIQPPLATAAVGRQR